MSGVDPYTVEWNKRHVEVLPDWKEFNQQLVKAAQMGQSLYRFHLSYQFSCQSTWQEAVEYCNSVLTRAKSHDTIRGT
jgi:hypothetical protein